MERGIRALKKDEAERMDASHSDWILSKILDTFGTFVLVFPVPSTLLTVQVHGLVLENVYLLLGLSTNVLQSNWTESTNVLQYLY